MNKAFPLLKALSAGGVAGIDCILPSEGSFPTSCRRAKREETGAESIKTRVEKHSIIKYTREDCGDKLLIKGVVYQLLGA